MKPFRKSRKKRGTFRPKKNDKPPATRAALEIYGKLDKMLAKLLTLDNSSEQKKEREKVVIMFDESHDLLKTEFDHTAFLFRCVRLWLREIRRNQQIVAVFAGTSSKFTTDYTFETEANLKSREASSRHWRRVREYHKDGHMVYAPLFRTTTIGSYAVTEIQPPDDKTECDTALLYGRPLFAAMAESNMEGGEGSVLEHRIPSILTRMLYWPQSWNGRKSTPPRIAVMGMLGTRIQVGQPSIEMSSNLVATGYANFCGYNSETNVFQLGFLPDPVPAHLSMCMMDEDFMCTVDGV